MKKIILIIIGIVVVGLLIYIATEMNEDSKVTPETSLFDFEIKDTAAVTKIVVYNSFSNKKYTVTRKKGEKWYGPKHTCIEQEIPKMMLTTFKDVTLKGYVPKTAMDNMKRILMAQYKKIDIYKGGKLVKTWYVGQSTQDHLGTYMLLETPNRKSDNPVIMGMKGFYGILKPRFVADGRRYECTNLFNYPRKDIQSVHLINRINPSQNFTITHTPAGGYSVTSNGQAVANVNQDNLIFYLNGFKNVHFYGPNYTLDKKGIDSLKKMPPDIELNVTAKNSSYDLKLYRRPDSDVKQPKDSTIYDSNLLWGITNEGKVMVMQYYGIGPIIQGKTIFVDTKKSK